MGWAKYHEDNIEISENRMREMYEAGYVVNNTTQPPTFQCAYCHEFFLNKNDVFSHIRLRHNNTVSLIFVNGQIVQKEVYVDNLVSLIIIRYDNYNSLHINKNVLNFGENNEMDLTKVAQDVLLHSNELHIKVGEKTWIIKKISKDTINTNLIEAALCRWSDEAERHQTLSKPADKNVNSAERKCLAGFYNYFLACVCNSYTDKKSRYEDALETLSGFEQILSSVKFVLQIIRFKLNWIGELKRNIIKKDVFSCVVAYFDNTSSENLAAEFSGTKRVFVEDEILSSIQSILDFLASDLSSVDAYLSKYPKSLLDNIEDINLHDRIYLLLARRAIKNGEYHLARRYYDEIITPYFETERAQFIKNI